MSDTSKQHKERIKSLFPSYSWRGPTLFIIALACLGYLYYDRNAPYRTESGVVMAVVLLLGSIVNYYAGSSKDQSDRAKVDRAKHLAEITQTETPPFNEGQP